VVDLPDELRNRPPRPEGQEPTATLTLEAYQRLKNELDELTTDGREELAVRIKAAREHGDIRENAEYDAAKNEQGLMESRIRKIQDMLRDPEIVEAPSHADAVGPGMLVTVLPLDEDDEDDEGEETYLLAEHAEERAPGARTVTTSSPFGSALLGAAEGKEVAYQAPGGEFRYRVLSFEPFAG
jgi:transcription elongation factor GreA